MKKMFSMMFVALTAIALISCGGGGSSGDVTGEVDSIAVVSSSSTGDFTPSISPSVGTGGTIKFTVGAMDIDTDGTIESPKFSSIKATSAKAMTTKATSTSIDCVESEISGDSSEKFDIGFCLDTTGSMGGAASIIASKISDFAESLSTAGVDARYAGITVGDAYATKKTTSSAYPVAAETLDITDNTIGTLTPDSGTLPTFDDVERPNTDTGVALLPATGIATFFDLVAEVGASGGDHGPENYLGCVKFLNDESAWRTDASRIIVLVSDYCAQTTKTYTIEGITAPWIPPTTESLIEELSGVATVHVIGGNWSDETLKDSNGDDVPSRGDCPTYSIEGYSGDLYDPMGLATSTGGTFSTFGLGSCSIEATCPVDLTKLPIEAAITGSTLYACDGTMTTYDGTAGTTVRVTFVIITTATGSTSGTTYTATTTIVMDVTFK